MSTLVHHAPRHPATADPLRDARMRVWIDQDLCTGDGICEDLCPEVFVILEDGIAYVQEPDRVMNDPGGHTGLARVAAQHEDLVIEAARGCPGECIFVELADDEL